MLKRDGVARYLLNFLALVDYSAALRSMRNSTLCDKYFSYRGLEAVAVDYVRASIFGPLIPKIAIGLVYLLSIATLGGLFYIISHDVGLANGIKQLWAIKSDSQKA